MKKHCNTVAHNTSIWAFFLSISKLQQFFRFHFQGQLLHPSTSVAIRPTDVAFLPQKKWEIFFSATWNMRSKQLPLKGTQKKSTLWMSTFWILKSWWPWKNLLTHLFPLQDLVFLYINKTSPPKSPRLVSSKDNKNAAPPSEILRHCRCRLLEHGLHSALPVTLFAGYMNDQWDVHQQYLHVILKLK